MKTKRFKVKPAATLSLMLFVFGIPGSSQDVVNQKPTEFLLKALERELKMTRDGGTASDCLVVLPTGAFKLERRLQQLPAPSVTHALYEGQLSDAELGELKDLLNAQEVLDLPSYEYVRPPGDFYELHSLVAHIARSGGMQKVGYYRWNSNDPQDSFERAPVAMRTALEDEAAALEPLSKWLHHLEAMQTKPSSAEAAPCDLEDAGR